MGGLPNMIGDRGQSQATHHDGRPFFDNKASVDSLIQRCSDHDCSGAFSKISCGFWRS